MMELLQAVNKMNMYTLTDVVYAFTRGKKIAIEIKDIIIKKEYL
jgi:hypothetical protein